MTINGYKNIFCYSKQCKLAHFWAKCVETKLNYVFVNILERATKNMYIAKALYQHITIIQYSKFYHIKMSLIDMLILIDYMTRRTNLIILTLLDYINHRIENTLLLNDAFLVSNPPLIFFLSNLQPFIYQPFSILHIHSLLLFCHCQQKSDNVLLCTR